MQTSIAVANGKITGTLKFIEGGLSPSGPLAGDGYFMALKWSNPDTDSTSLLVGLQPSEGTGLVECIDDTDRNGVFKITDKNTQELIFVQSDGHNRTAQVFDLSGLTLEEPVVGA